MRLLRLKSTSILLFLLALTICVGCSKKDADEQPSIDDIVGTWKPTAFTYDGYWKIGGETIAVMGQGNGLSSVLITFHEDGTIKGNGENMDLFIIGKTNNTKKAKMSTDLFKEDARWERNGNILNVTGFYGAFTNKLTVAEVTVATLHLTASFERPIGSGMMSSVDIQFTRSN